MNQKWGYWESALDDRGHFLERRTAFQEEVQRVSAIDLDMISATCSQLKIVSSGLTPKKGLAELRRQKGSVKIL